MGQGLSCPGGQENGIFEAVASGDVEAVVALLEDNPLAVHLTTIYDRLTPLHVAAANGRAEVLSLILDSRVNPDVMNRHKQTPLMLAAMKGKIACVHKLTQSGANILLFDSLNGRTCLHYAAYYGHQDCLQAILDAAHQTPVADSWGFSRFVNIRDGNGATPLHLAARQRQAGCAHILLGSGALVCASASNFGCAGSTPLHLAARGGSLDCVRELLARGADRRQRDSSGRIAYIVALKHKHGACAALLNPSSPEPLVWPSPLKVISKLNPEAKVLLEKALLDANREREKDILKGYSLPSPSHSEGSSDSGIDPDIDEVSDSELCCICFEQVCTIEVQECGHQMCAHCTLALCCHSKPNPSTASLTVLVCPFCRSNIGQLVVAKIRSSTGEDDLSSSFKLKKSRWSRNLSEGSSSFKGISALGSLGKMTGRSSGGNSESPDWIEKN